MYYMPSIICMMKQIFRNSTLLVFHKKEIAGIFKKLASWRSWHTYSCSRPIPIPCQLIVGGFAFIPEFSMLKSYSANRNEICIGIGMPSSACLFPFGPMRMSCNLVCLDVVYMVNRNRYRLRTGMSRSPW